MKQQIFFIGIGGSGMNGIARLMNLQGHLISGSDREHDRGHQPDLFKSMSTSGIALFPQDSSGIHRKLDFVVTSTAIESSIPDVRAAMELGIPVIHRSVALANLIKPFRSIAVAGTSGKSTVTGMCAWVLKACGFDPTVINGAKIIGIESENTDSDILFGHGPFAVFEADESDGSLIRFAPSIGVLTNITKDHMPVADLIPLFTQYINNIEELLVFNADCSVSSELSKHISKSASFGIAPGSDFRITNPCLSGMMAACTVEGHRIKLKVPGFHNLQNALAAYVILRHLGKSPAVSADALESFRGIQRRFQIVGSRFGITVVDDFAHNPDKIRATMDVTDQLTERAIYIYQPHGYGPTRLLFKELTEQFASGLRSQDKLYLTPIFYAGGTAQKDICSEDLCDGIRTLGGNATVLDRSAIPTEIGATAAAGDWVIVMGARDPSLTDFSQLILDHLRNQSLKSE